MNESNIRKVALVTGSSQGIGRAIALRLANDGFDVAVNDIERASDALHSLVAEITGLGRRAYAAVADVSDAGQVQAMVEQSVSALGRLDVSVANAGIARVENLIDVPVEHWDQMFAVNVRGVFLTHQAAAKQMIAQGEGGKIIGAASQAAMKASGLFASYSASKFAVRGLTQAAAQEWAKHQITVNAYAPGIVDTKLWEAGDEQLSALTGTPPGAALKGIIASIPLGRVQRPEDVASLVSFLAGKNSDYMTGQTLIMDGGMVFA